MCSGLPRGTCGNCRFVGSRASDRSPLPFSVVPSRGRRCQTVVTFSLTATVYRAPRMLAVNWLSPRDLIDTFGAAGLLLVDLPGVGRAAGPVPGRLPAVHRRVLRLDQGRQQRPAPQSRRRRDRIVPRRGGRRPGRLLDRQVLRDGAVQARRPHLQDEVSRSGARVLRGARRPRRRDRSLHPVRAHDRADDRGRREDDAAPRSSPPT